MKEKLKCFTLEDTNKWKWAGIVIGIVGGLSLAGAFIYKKTCEEIMNIRIENIDSDFNEVKE